MCRAVVCCCPGVPRVRTDNQLGPKGAEHMAGALAQCKQLQSVNFGCTCALCMCVAVCMQILLCALHVMGDLLCSFDAVILFVGVYVAACELVWRALFVYEVWM